MTRGTAAQDGPRGRSSFSRYVRRSAAGGELVVQPRMGFGDTHRMLEGLVAVREARARTVGTITVDSYTRVGDLGAVREALARGHEINGFPIASMPEDQVQEMLGHVYRGGFPVQVRHGSADPGPIFESMLALGMDASEGGPVSYCLPYSRVPLAQAIDDWARSCDRFSEAADGDLEPHLESFGGCMLGQMCPPSLLIAITVLEALFFAQHGVKSISLSLTQQTHHLQDLEALRALRFLAERHLEDIDWHVVLYAYMGVFPETRVGSQALMADATALAVAGGAERLIVKTEAEARRIPSIDENVDALELAAESAWWSETHEPGEAGRTSVADDAETLITTVLDLHDDVGEALRLAFARGLLDVPYCVHRDNAGKSRSYVDWQGYLRWSDVGDMPIRPDESGGPDSGSAALLRSLRHVANRYDTPTPRSRR